MALTKYHFSLATLPIIIFRATSGVCEALIYVLKGAFDAT